MLQRVSKQEAELIQGPAKQNFLAKLYQAVTGSESDVYEVTQALDAAFTESAAIEINCQFKGFFVVKVYNTATGAIDPDTFVNIKLEKNIKGKDSLSCNHNYSYDSEAVYSKAFLWFAAAAGKSVKIQFFKFGVVRSGTIYGATTVTTTKPSVFGVGYSPVVAAATPVLMFAANTASYYREFQNNDPSDVWIGPATVSNANPNLGLKIPAGGYYKTDSTAAIYVYSVLGYAVGTGLVGWERT